MPDLIIVGAGGLAREVAQAVPVRGFLDDSPALCGRFVDGLPVLGDTKSVPPDAQLLVCVGTGRDRITDRLGLPSARYATVVHPRAWVSPSSSVGHGSVLLAGVVLTASVRVGAHVAVMPNVTLTHDDVLDDFVTVASGVQLAGGVHVGRGAYLGAGAQVREGLTIGPDALVGMGAVVVRDVPPGEVWIGNPARPYKERR